MEKIWTLDNTRRLYAMAADARAEDRPLSGVYREIAAELGIREGSVRNYYYAGIKTLKMLDKGAESVGIRLPETRRTYDAFRKGEAEEVVAAVLRARARGKSVRAAVRELAGGDERTALRYQNKYRSLVFKQRSRTEKLLMRMAAEDAPYFDPYACRVVSSNEQPAEQVREDSGAYAALEQALGRPKAARLVDAIAEVLCGASAAKRSGSAFPALKSYVRAAADAREGSATSK